MGKQDQDSTAMEASSEQPLQADSQEADPEARVAFGGNVRNALGATLWRERKEAGLAWGGVGL